jgi:hypothetical protein
MPPFSLTSTGLLKADSSDKVLSRSCARIKRLGYIPGKRMTLYGEHFEIVSDPFTENNCVAVRVISGGGPAIRTIRLPVSLLIGLTDLFSQHVN